MSSLAELLESQSITVFRGIQKGGQLKPTPDFPITSTTPPLSDFNSIYSERYVNPFFLTFVCHNKKDFFIQLDEFYPGEGWRRQLGVGQIISLDEVVINETDGTVGRLLKNGCSCGDAIYTLYRSRSGTRVDGKFRPFVQLAKACVSSCQERDYNLHRK